MPAGLSTPLHLAANLLALSAAAGLALTVWTRPGVLPGRPSDAVGRSVSEWLVAAGGAALVCGHILSGVLVDQLVDASAWLLAGGLALLAAGVSPARVAALRGAPAVMPMPLESAAVGAVAGLVAGVRALLAGRRAVLVGVGLLAWGLARGLQPFLPGVALWATVAGSLAVAAWVWQASARRLLARLVTGFVVSLLGVVVLLAVVLSTLGATALVDDELRTLERSSADLAGSVGSEWPRQAIDAAEILRGSPDLLTELVEQRNTGALQQILVRTFGGQDFLAILSPDGRVLLSASEVETLGEGAFLLSLPGAEPVERLLDGERESGGLLTVGGQVVAIGGILVFDEGAVRAEDAPRLVVVTGRIADSVWAAQAAAQLPFGVLVETGGGVSAASGRVAGIDPALILDTFPEEQGRAAFTAGEVPLFGAAAPIVDPHSQAQVGRVLATRSGEVLGQIEREQARQLFLIALVGAVLAGAVAAALAGRVVAPIRRLTAAAAAVREGDLGATAEVGSRDEVGELGRTFDEMTTSLAWQSAQLREAADVQSRLRARLEALTASMGDALVAVDTDGKIVTFNAAAERLVGRDVAEVIGLPLDEVLIDRGAADRPGAVPLGPPDSEEAAAGQILLESGHGRVVPAAVTAAPVRDSGGAVLGRVLVLRDISREAEVERMKTEFLSNVSHELRTPLTPIKGYAELLTRGRVGTDATKTFAGEILEAAERLERVVASIMDFAALDSGRMRPEPASTSVEDVVADALARWRERAPERDFRRRLSRGLPRLWVDARMLHRCLDELLDNAVKFSPGREPVVVTAELDDAGPEPRVLLSVRDRGIGMEPRAAADVFADFYQVDASETRHFGGLGLGLALVRRLVDALDGDARVRSRPGGGTTVHLWLPVADDAGEQRDGSP